MPHTVENPPGCSLDVHILVVEASLVQLWVLQRRLLRHVLIQDTEHNDREHGVQDVEHLVHEVAVELLARKTRDEAKEILGQHDHDVLVECVAHEDCHPSVAPSAMDQQQVLEESELRDPVVADVEGLQALQTADANTHIRALDHVAVVRSVADGECDGLLHALDERDDGTLLLRRDAAADDGLAHPADGHEVHLVLRLQGVLEALAVDHETLKRGNLPSLLRVLLQLPAQVLRLELTVHLKFPRRQDRPVLPFRAARLKQARGDADVDRRLNLVAGEHPDLDTGLHHFGYRVADLVLQPVLDASDAVQLKVALDRISRLVKSTLAVGGCDTRLVEPD
mmetsp:Transcript_4981/g.12839  ORF Transcript_4981/g.12839 Transcript_4981/m.12839 type:complete len:338 (+) Transcript_4981:957-1970(+)